MELKAAVERRQSIRAFKPDAIPLQTLREILDVARHAASWANTQPWELAVATGKELRQIKKAFADEYQRGERAPDLPGAHEFPEPYNARRRHTGGQMLEIKGIPREDREKRRWWNLQGLGLFGAPAAIYIYTDTQLVYQSHPTITNVWPVFDIGMLVQNIMLLALEHNLGTLTAIQSVAYPDVLREVLGIPESKTVVIGLAIGYPDFTDPINEFRSPREPLDSIARFHGFRPV